MKKITFLFMLFISSVTFACSIDSAGYCSVNNTAYFKTHSFPRHAKFQIRYLGSQGVILEFTTKDAGNTDTVFNVSQPDATPIQIQFRFKDIDSNDNHYTKWGSYQGGGFTTSASFDYAGCGVLAVGLTNFAAQKIDNGHIRVSFESYSNSNIDRWEILVSDKSDSTAKWVKVAEIKPVGGQTKYDSTINLYAVGLGFGLLVLPFFKRKLFFLSLALMIIVYSCSKSLDTQKANYKFVKVNEVSKEGKIQSVTGKI